jgi:D-Tyr-tRNAtyr deacylase
MKASAAEKRVRKENSHRCFGADMNLLNDGPVTIIIDSKNRE